MNVLAITEKSVIISNEGKIEEIDLSLIDEHHDIVCSMQSFRLGFSSAMFQILSKEQAIEEK